MREKNDGSYTEQKANPLDGLVVHSAAWPLPSLSILSAAFHGTGRCFSVFGFFRVGLLVSDEYWRRAYLSCSMADGGGVFEIRAIRGSHTFPSDDDHSDFTASDIRKPIGTDSF